MGTFSFISFILVDYETDIVSGETVIRLYEYLLQRGAITSLILRAKSLLHTDGNYQVIKRLHTPLEEDA